MKIVPLAILLGLITACSPQGIDRSDAWRKSFEGTVVAVDDNPLYPSFRITFYSIEDGGETHERYKISSECIDYGYFDKDRQAFLSGSSPYGAGADRMSEKNRQDMAEGNRRSCPSDHAITYNRLLDVMYEGAALTINGQDGRLVSKSGASISLVRVPMVITL